ncbi:MAG TPA: nucleotidyltransferase family protein [Chitinophagaceae bacterium]
MKAMILAAGLGTRLKPFTDQHPKALAMINGRSLLQRNIEYLASFGITDVIVNVHHFPDQITDSIKKNKGFGSNVTISDEKDEVLETGGGLMKARKFLADSDPFILMNVDILTDMDIGKMAEQHIASKALATLAVTSRKTTRYFLFDELQTLCGWKNIKTGEQKISKEAKKFIEKAFSGIHIISPEIFGLIKMTGKFSMVEVYLQLCKTHTITGFDHSTTKFIDVGRPENILIAEEIFS